jgi:redox-sensitive bicupin YhaK (pirin superfamily)
MNTALDTIIVPRTHDLGDRFEVRRALPSVQRRMVGPFVFLDQMGPTLFKPGRGIDVRPHPHIGLSTLSYLMAGEILHRDSIGSEQTIRPGAVNWMTAGRGIVHSERSPALARASGFDILGLQCWVALPKPHEETEPSFTHLDASEVPVLEGDGVVARIAAGAYFGKRSRVPVFSDQFFVDVGLDAGARIEMPATYPEQAFYIVSGKVDLGADGIHEAGRLMVLKPGAALTIAASGDGPATIVMLGGEPLDGPRHIAWNFVSSSRDRIEQAKDDWRSRRFASVPGDDTEFIPLPPEPPAPASAAGVVDYP